METNKLSLVLVDEIKKYPNYALRFHLDVVIPEVSASSIHTLAGIGIDDADKTIMAFIQ